MDFRFQIMRKGRVVPDGTTAHHLNSSLLGANKLTFTVESISRIPFVLIHSTRLTRKRGIYVLVWFLSIFVYVSNIL